MRLLMILVCLTGCGNRTSTASCAALADNVHTLFGGSRDPNAAALRTVFAARCETDSWSAEARACIAGTRSLDEPKNCKQKLTPEQVSKLDADIAAVEERQAREAIPVACVRYERVLAAALACDAFPKDVRDSLKQNYDVFKATWPGTADKRTLAPICGSAVDALKAAGGTCPDAAKW